MNYFVHPQGIVESGHIGTDTHIWAFAHVLPGAVIGDECNICDHVFIENDVVVGNRVTIKSGVQLWDGITVEDDVFIGPNATFTNDPFPRSKQRPEKFARTVIRHGASVGANATILPGLTVGQHAMIGAGAVVTRDVPPHAIVAGNPAQITGYAPRHKEGRIPAPAVEAATLGLPRVLAVPGVTVQAMPIITDMRGSLSVGEYGQQIPFFAPAVLLGVRCPEPGSPGRARASLPASIPGLPARVVPDCRRRRRPP